MHASAALQPLASEMPAAPPSSAPVANAMPVAPHSLALAVAQPAADDMLESFIAQMSQVVVAYSSPQAKQSACSVPILF